MLESLEILSNSLMYDYVDDGSFDPIDTEAIAARIQAEIDKYYKPLPLFEDGEPATVGMECLDGSDVIEIKGLGWRGDVTIVTLENGWDIVLHPGDRLKRPPEPDTQEKIDADYRNETNSLITDSGRGCMTRERALKYVESFDELMARQRKLDGVDA